MKAEYDKYVSSQEDLQYFYKFRIQKENAPIFKVELGDILKNDWSEADCIFANSTCFSPDLML